MSDKFPKLYDLHKTTIWFSIASLVLFIGLVTMVIQDSSREWKGWQKKFMKLSREKVETALEQAQKSVDEKKLEMLEKELTQSRVVAQSHKDEIQRIQQQIEKIEVEITKAKTRYQDLKQNQDSERYFFEEHRAHGEKEKAEKLAKKLEALEKETQTAKLDAESLEAQRDNFQAEISKFTESQEKIEREIKRQARDMEALRKKVKKLSPNWVQAILNAPMLDFIAPSLQIQQIVVENIYDDYYFSKVEKVDRCITCHLGIDQKGFEDAPSPFKTHPRFDLFLSPNSPHPMEKFGCTVCHGGSGHSVSFVTAAHTPHSEEQAKEWEKEHHWHPMKHWQEKMLPLHYVEASCAKCHTGVVEVPQAPKLNQGRSLAREFGCFACHKVGGFENQWKVGPSLLHVQSKLEPDWIVRWLQNPKEFRASSKMPRIFHLSNTADPESKTKNDTAIAGIATYLMKNSEPIELQSSPAQGKPEEGEKLVKSVGCLGCHTVGSLAANHHGPELSGLGSKVKADWLFTWLKDPKHYSPETRMPNLRLSDEEAAHIVSFLLSNRNEKFESLRAPHVEPAVVDDLALSFMTGKMRHDQAAAELEKMSPEARLEFVGHETIAQMGCFGCHDIKGFENSKPIGTELTLEGSKEIEKLDFGFIDIPRTRQAWFFQKLKEPRIFDRGKVKAYHEKLRMPQFDFTDEQAEALTLFILSLQKAEIPLEMKDRVDLKEEQVEAGRLLLAKFNCQGCHTLDGKEGAVRSLIEDKGNAPPTLFEEGKKVRENWLYDFLNQPTTIRPWLQYRMPTFGFDDLQLKTLVQYFNGLSDMEPSLGGDRVPATTPEELVAGKELFKQFQCIKCHQSEPSAGLSASFLAPDLVIAKDRLRPNWILAWLSDPQTLQPGTMMPAFFPEGQSPSKDILGGEAERQIKALRDYLMLFTHEDASSLKQTKK